MHADKTGRLARAAAMAGIVALALAGCSSSGNGDAGGASDQTTASTSRAASTLTLADVEKGVDLTQCGKQTRTIKHDLGTTTITGDPTRVVVLEYTFADAVASLGVQPVGVADDSKPDRVKGLGPDLGNYTSVGLRQSPSLATITSVKPDLIIADTERDKTIYGQLNKIAPTVAFASLSASYAGVLTSDLQVAVAMNKCDQMQQRLKQHFQTMDQLASDVPAGKHPTFVYAVTDQSTFYAHSANQWEPAILETLGFRSALEAKPGSQYVELSLEQLFAAKPDILFLGPTGDQSIVDQWKSSPVWQQIPAVQNHMVFTVNEPQWTIARSVDNSEAIAKQAIDDVYTRG